MRDVLVQLESLAVQSLALGTVLLRSSSTFGCGVRSRGSIPATSHGDSPEAASDGGDYDQSDVARTKNVNVLRSQAQGFSHGSPLISVNRLDAYFN